MIQKFFRTGLEPAQRPLTLIRTHSLFYTHHFIQLWFVFCYGGHRKTTYIMDHFFKEEIRGKQSSLHTDQKPHIYVCDV